MTKGLFCAALTLSLVIASAVVPVAHAQNKLALVEHGQSDYKIVVPWGASPSEKYAAEDLQRIIEEMSGAKLPIVDDGTRATNKEIIIGSSQHWARLATNIPFQKHGDEGFTIVTAGDTLMIIGGPKRGTMYGVYTFLEKYLGCRWYSPEVSIIPKMRTIAIGPINETYAPPLKMREVNFFHATVTAGCGDWAARNKLNGQGHRLGEEHGGSFTIYPMVHTFNYILNPAEHFEEHPEYFSMRDGKRMGEPRTQLCLTNPDVLTITIRTVKRWIREHPDVKVFSVSQNDWGNWCECPSCKAIDEAEESHAGSLIAFVNKVAEAIEEDYPDVVIDTLAYQYTRKAPKNLVPRHNVNVRLCSIECCFAHPLEGCDYPENVSFTKDIEAWSKKTDRLFIWDYVVAFHHYFMPFANLESLQPNMQFFVKHAVKGVYEEGAHGVYMGCSRGAEFAELRVYLLAKLLWNPDVDIEVVMDDFLRGYYGNAGPHIKKYINMLHEKARVDNYHMECWAVPEAAFFTDEVIAEGLKIFEEAKKEELTPDERARVEIAELPIMYVKMVLWLKEKLEPAFVERFFQVTEREELERHSYSRMMWSFKDEMMKKIGK